MSDLLIFLQVSVFGIGRTMIDPSSVGYLRLLKTYSFAGGIIGIVIGKGLKQMIIIILNMMRANPMLLLSTALLMVILFFYYILTAIALFQSAIWRNQDLLETLTIGLYFNAKSGGVISADRFRLPIILFICLLEGYGWWMLIIKRNNHIYLPS